MIRNAVIALILVVAFLAARFHAIHMHDGLHFVEKPALSYQFTYINTRSDEFASQFEKLPKATKEWILDKQAALLGDKIQSKIEDVKHQVFDSLDKALSD